MTDQDDRREEIADRMARLRHDADWRRAKLVILAVAEREALAIVASPGPTVVDGEIVYGEDGKPVPDRDIQREAEGLLADIRRDLAELRGPGGTG